MGRRPVGEELKTSGNRQQASSIKKNPSATGGQRLEAAQSLPSTLTLRPLTPTKHRGYVVVDEQRCKACELCLEVCPEGALELSPALNSFGYHPARLKEDNSCTGCALCAQVCPDVALEVYRE